MKEQEKILVVDDEPQMQLALKTSLTRKGYDVTIAGDGKIALGFLENDSFDLIISDQRMPELTGDELLSIIQERDYQVPFIMITAHGTIDRAVKAMQLGAADFITKPFSVDELISIVERVLSPISKEFRENQKSSFKQKGNKIVTNDAHMIRLLEMAEAVARSDATVLIQGESGTGKEGIAKFIHLASPRAKQPFVAVNCAALPENLLESELFGHEKGAFTGAQSNKQGKFELAQGGTILLDEISEMDLALQAKLLRVLQEKEVDRVGGTAPVQIDVRVLATTNRNLEMMAQKGEFREDLFYRLNVIPLTLPPLRDRHGDVRLLVKHFMREFLGDDAPALTPEVIQTLEQHFWPGNIRELQNAVQRASILAGGKPPNSSHFLLQPGKQNLASQIEVERDAEGSDSETSNIGDDLMIHSGMTVSNMEKNLILETLKATQDNRTQAAKLLGISIRTLRNKLNEYGYKKGGAFSV